MTQGIVVSPTAAAVIAEPARPSLRRNFSWTLAGNIGYAGCQWGMLVAIAKLGRPEMVGHFALALAIGAPVYMLTNLQLRVVQATDFAGQYRFTDYFRLRLLMTALAFAAIATIAFAVYRTRPVIPVILLVSLAKAFEAISDIYYGRFQQLELMDRISISMLIKGLVSLAALGLTLKFTGSLPAACAVLALSWLAVLLFYDSRAPWPPETAYLPGSPRPLLRLTRFAAPLGISMMLITLNVNIPRYFVEHYLGAHDLGIFAALSYLVIAGSTVTNALGQAATPRLASSFARRRREFYSLLRKMLLLGMALGMAGILGAALFGRFALRLIYRPEYAQHQNVFVWLMAAAAISYVFSFLGYAGTATRVYDQLLIPQVLVTLFTLGAAFLVRPFGLTGAAWSMCAMYAASCAVPLWILHCAGRVRKEQDV
jgi:O-antigen/teichoic acid export membrane protein